ncbi:MAG: DUF3817 domain-containing protein [Trueperaceae bacterium]|nr:DUF3817 domain-containing protein [Trueperaceae bacterium]
MAVDRSSAPTSLITFFRAVAHIEAVSWAGLLLGMLFKYVITGQHALGEDLVYWFGRVHGLLVLVYVVLAVNVGGQLKWSLRDKALALVAAVPPFATVVFDRWAAARGLYLGKRLEQG